MANRSGGGVALRLGLEADASVKSTFDEIEKSGNAAAKRLVADFQRAGEDVEKALARQNSLGSRVAAIANGGDRPNADAQVRAYTRVMAEAERQAAALRNVIFPLAAAQAEYDREVEVANRLLRLNVINEAEHAEAVAISTQRLDAFRAEQMKGAANDNARRSTLQNVGYQFQDFIVQVDGGTSVLRALTQQAPQALSAIAMLGSGAEATSGKFMRFANFLGGGWGIAITTGITLAGALASKLLDQGDAADTGTKATESLETAIHELNVTTGKEIQTSAQAAQAAYNEADAQRAAEVEVRKHTKALLEQAIAKRDRVFLDERRGNLAAPQAAGEVASLRAQLAAQDTAIGQAEQNVRRRYIPIMQAIVKEGQDPAAAATARHARQVALLNAAFEAGGIQPATYQARIAAADAELAAATATTRTATSTAGRHAAAVRGQGDAMASAARAAKDLLGDLTSLESRFSPLEAAWRQASLDKERIAKLLALGPENGGIDEATATMWRRQIAQGLIDSAEKAAADAHAKVTGSLQSALQTPGPWVADDDIDAMADRAMKAINTSIAAVAPGMQRLRDVGVDLVDKVLSPSSWREWGGSGKAMIREIGDELFKLALINPLKNLISGNSDKQTLSSLITSVAGIFGKSPTPHASGTEYAPGGLSLVGEFGKELVDMPRGARVIPAAETRRLMGGASAPATHNHYYIEGNLLTPEFWAQIQAGNDGAATRGAYGGAQIAAARADRRQRRTIRR